MPRAEAPSPVLPPPSHDDRSRFDFAEGMRSFNYRAIVRPLLEDYPRRVAALVDAGGAVYRLAWRAGYDARPGALEAFVRSASQPAPARVLDVGCSFGGLTRVLRKVFPAAEVIGIDLSLPALSYAHALAERSGSNIT